MTILPLLLAASLSAEDGQRSFRGFTVPMLRAEGVPEPSVLTVAKAWLTERVDVQAEALRTSLVTPGSGQAMEYQETQAQAAAALKAPSSATADKYPMLAASIGIDIDPNTGQPAADVLGVARSVDAARTGWVAAGAFIRGVRLSGKRAVDAAATVEAAAAAYDGITWQPEPSRP